MPRAPRGYRTLPSGEIVKLATFSGIVICRQSNRRVTEAQRRRKVRDCPMCGAPDIEWYSQLHPDLLFWKKHERGQGNVPQLDIFETEPDTKDDDELPPF